MLNWFIDLASVLLISWIAGLMTWAKLMSNRLHRFIAARHRAAQMNIADEWVDFGVAIRLMAEDFDPLAPWNFSPLHWVRSLRKDYLALARKEREMEETKAHAVVAPQLRFTPVRLEALKEQRN